ncbi:ATP/GTP-binding protein [Patescibacteria group bacterium]
MIHEVKFKNFFSFKDEGIISFKVNEKAPKTEKYFADATGGNLSKVMSIFGHNASGKTNALKAISFLQWFVVYAYTEKPDAKMPVVPFKFTNKKSDPVEISVEFSIGKSLYIYFVSFTTHKILNEKLKKKSHGKVKFSTLFERSWKKGEKNNYIWNDKFNLGKNFHDRLRENASVLATAIRDKHLESMEIFDFWKNVDVNVTAWGKMNNESRNLVSAANFFENNPKIKKKADKLLQKFDIGLEAINITKKEDDNGGVAFDLRGSHYGEYDLDFRFESSGTKKLFSILKNILQTLEFGGVAVLDEFDTDLHPMMSEALLEMFFSKETNPNNAQLIFSAHSPHLLNLLDKYQIAFTEKNEKGESEIWRMNEMENVRSDDNYYAKYLSGAYGAIPEFDL